MTFDDPTRDPPSPPTGRTLAVLTTVPASREDRVPPPAPRGEAEAMEREVQALVQAGDVPGAVALALRAHGAEVFGFLLGVLDGGRPPRDAYAAFGARLREGLGAFGWRCPLRIWMYALARAELALHDGAPAAKGDREVITLPAPTTTMPCRPAGMGEAIAALRESLSIDDRAVLVLRVDRRLSLSDLAVTSLGEGASPAEIVRETGRLREQLQHIRAALALAAAERNLLRPR